MNLSSLLLLINSFFLASSFVTEHLPFSDLYVEGGICSCIGSNPPQEYVAPDDEDVLQEENIVKQQVREGLVDPNVAVQIRGLAKTYPGTCTVGCCCKCKRTTPYHAVKVRDLLSPF